LSESEAIVHYICLNKGGESLVGVSTQDRIHIMQVKGVVDDLRLKIGLLAYD